MKRQIAVAVRIHNSGDRVFADVKTLDEHEYKITTIDWSSKVERRQFIFNTKTLFYDTRTTESFLKEVM